MPGTAMVRDAAATNETTAERTNLVELKSTISPFRESSGKGVRRAAGTPESRTADAGRAFAVAHRGSYEVDATRNQLTCRRPKLAPVRPVSSAPQARAAASRAKAPTMTATRA
ncbi:hypothetical protein GCM10019017_34850 [Streptomyces showdoensis]